MTIDKRMSYEMQGGSKPARNYLGKQKTVSNIPVKWKSGPDAPSTELAYITKAEKDLLLKKNLHGSLKNGPNTGPDNIMSLDSQGDYTRDRSRDKARSQMSRGNQERENRQEAAMKAILTGQKNIGQTTQTGPKTRKYAVPEYVKVKQPGGGYKDKYIGSGYKSYGTPSFFGNLFSRGAPGYRGIKGMPAFGGKSGFEARGVPGQRGFGYYSDQENFGDTRDALPLGIMGLLSNLLPKKKSRDFSEDNRKGLYEDRFKEDFNRNRKIPGPGESEWSDGTFTWPGTTGPGTTKSESTPTGTVYPGYSWENQEDVSKKGLVETISDKLTNIDTAIPDWLRWGSGMTEFIPKGTSIGDAFKGWKKIGEKAYEDQWLTNNPAFEFGEKVYDWTHNPDNFELAKNIWPTYRGALEDAGVGEWGANLQEDVSNKGWSDTITDRLMNIDTKIPFTDATIGDAFKGYKGMGEDIYNIGDKIREGINPTPELTAEEQLDMGLLPDPFKPFKDGGRVGYANGGLASLFTRRG